MAQKLAIILVFSLIFTGPFLRAQNFPVEANAAHIVISEVQISGVESTNNDFIELYNPTTSAVDLSTMKLVKRTKSGTSDSNIVSFIRGDEIAPYGFFLWCNTSVSEQVVCDRTTSATISNHNSIALREEPSDAGSIVDAVTIGDVAHALGEGSPIVPSPENGGSIERKAGSTATTEHMVSGVDMDKGNGEDTNDNISDFIYRVVSLPQSTQSESEVPGIPSTPVPTTTPTGTPAISYTPTPTEPTPSIAPSITPSASDQVVLSEIQIGGSTSTDEFVELYNVTDQSIDITGWKLLKKTSQGADYTVVTNLTGIIEAYGYYLVAHTNYVGGIAADIAYEETSISSNNTIRITDQHDNIIDTVGMGSAEEYEGSGTASSPSNSRSIERKANASATKESMVAEGVDERAGNGYDSDDNNLDFVLRPAEYGTDPQNTLSPSEGIDVTITPTSIPTTTPTPTPMVTNIPTQAPSQTPTPMPTATSVIMPSPTPTQTHRFSNRRRVLFSRFAIACRREYRTIYVGRHAFSFPRLLCELVRQ